MFFVKTSEPIPLKIGLLVVVTPFSATLLANPYIFLTSEWSVTKVAFFRGSVRHLSILSQDLVFWYVLSVRPTVAAKPRPRTDLNTFDYICETPEPGFPFDSAPWTVASMLLM
jgi:hypothetical protein